MRNVYKIFVGKPEWKRPLVKPMHRWEGNVKWNLKKYGVDWIHMAQDRDQWWTFVDMGMNLRVPQKS
jgi:hypothetical protein